ncbi:hypothetical protein GDO78_012550 [Eleutherodactylus coqui]|uniref:Uncharacterized protein n=1 Tax=Eleutherodactylus coqui TaxID=57060 RepID=A0A8J6K518_ELECQ|nr:hypothetical protein GDO78_012550 [Eleutherodactylus coqui]
MSHVGSNTHTKQYLTAIQNFPYSSSFVTIPMKTVKFFSVSVLAVFKWSSTVVIELQISVSNLEIFRLYFWFRSQKACSNTEVRLLLSALYITMTPT